MSVDSRISLERRVQELERQNSAGCFSAILHLLCVVLVSFLIVSACLVWTRLMPVSEWQRKQMTPNDRREAHEQWFPNWIEHSKSQ